MTLVPLIELSQPPLPRSQQRLQREIQARRRFQILQSKNGFTFKLDNVIELDDGFVFTGNLSWDNSAFFTGKA